MARRIVPCVERVAMLRALRCVDQVVVFGEHTPEQLIAALRPDSLVEVRDSAARGNLILQASDGTQVAPVQAPVTGESPEANACAPPPQRVVRPLHILLVEDHSLTAKMMQMVLTAEGHTVETAGDVATALELAGQHTFDLLVSDLGLPDASGHDLLRGLRSRGQQFPGIALSGYGQEEDIRRSREAGFVAHLTKPASHDALVVLVASVAATDA